ncbi:MAG: DUF4167 domain-containing protein [Tabrizicola sp.]|jgi:hypothetical protein|nr:DUF4167 domain-containing protein [Tabrizicola sp.]
MRSSKKRSRSSQNRPRTLGNIVNRVFDSSGPEGKVRGTPQQIIEKYQMLARDAQLSNDRVAAENFLQHAEHYTRMLAEAMKELAAEQEARQQQYQQNGGPQGQGGQNGNQPYGQPRGDRQGDRGERQDRPDRGDRPERGDRPDRGDRRPEHQRDYAVAEQPIVVDVIDLDAGDDSGLIETPESSPRARVEPAPVVEAAEAKERPAKEEGTTRRPRSPRKPKADSKSADKATDTTGGEPPKEAAE